MHTMFLILCSDYMPETNTYVNDFIDKHELILQNELEIHPVN